VLPPPDWHLAAVTINGQPARVLRVGAAVLIRTRVGDELGLRFVGRPEHPGTLRLVVPPNDHPPFTVFLTYPLP
jgi:hypothetical protein